MALTAADAQAMQARIEAGQVVLYGTDTVYGLACDPRNPAAVTRMAHVKGRPDGKPSAALFFSLDAAEWLLSELAPPVQSAARALLPGPVTLLVDNPREHFAAICGADPATLGVRVPALVPGAQALASIDVAVAQSSANLAGGPEARTLAAVNPAVRSAVDLEVDAGELPGVASTVIDLRGLARGEGTTIVREGALSAAEVAALLPSVARRAR